MTDLVCFNENLVVIQGGAFDETYIWQIDGTPADLTGCTAKMQVRAVASSSSPALVDIGTATNKIVLGGTAGTVRLIIDASVTAGLAAGDYVYDVLLTYSTGTPQKFMRGTFTVLAGVTQ